MGKTDWSDRNLQSRNLVRNFNLNTASTGIAWNLPIWHGKWRQIQLPWHWGNFPFSECRISIFSVEYPFLEYRISIFWVQNSQRSVKSTIAVFEYKICIFWVYNFDFLQRNLHFLNSEFWAAYLKQFWVQNLHFLSIEFLFWLQNFDFLAQNSIFGAHNFHFQSAKFPFRSTESGGSVLANHGNHVHLHQFA